MTQSLHINRLNGGDFLGYSRNLQVPVVPPRLQKVTCSDRNIASVPIVARHRVGGPGASPQLFQNVGLIELLAADTEGHMRFPKVSTIAAGRYRVEMTAEIRGKGEGVTASSSPRLTDVDVETSFPGDTGKSEHVSRLRAVAWSVECSHIEETSTWKTQPLHA